MSGNQSKAGGYAPAIASYYMNLLNKQFPVTKTLWWVGGALSLRLRAVTAPRLTNYSLLAAAFWHARLYTYKP